MKTEGIFEKISGLNMPGLILLAARPGMGKTPFALNMARIAAEKKTAAVFSLEMSQEPVPLSFSHLRHRLRTNARMPEPSTLTTILCFLRQTYMPSVASWTIWVW